MPELKNYMEEVVWQTLEKLLAERPEVCSCEKCRLDMAAIALNKLPPRYTVTEKGKVFAKAAQLECQFKTDILMAVLKAIEIVGKNPRH